MSNVSYIVEFGQMSVKCETAADVVRLERELRRTPQRANGAGVPQTDESGARALKFLEIIRDSEGEGGISTRNLTSQLGLAGTRGLAGITGALNRRLHSHSLMVASAVRFRKTDDGEKIWSPGPRIAEAISALRETEEETSRAGPS